MPMARKTRYWVCDACPRIYLRKKHDGWMSCYECFTDMRKATKYPYAIAQRINKQEARGRKHKKEMKVRHNRCRNVFGYRLVISTGTRKAFKHLKAAKQKRSFVKRTNAFLESLRDDMWSLNGRANNTPAVNEQQAPTCTLKIWEGDSLLGKWNPAPFTIDLQWKEGDIVETLVHESTHYLDYMTWITADGNIGSHTQSFYKRCKDLGSLLNHEPKGEY